MLSGFFVTYILCGFFLVVVVVVVCFLSFNFSLRRDRLMRKQLPTGSQDLTYLTDDSQHEMYL